MRVAGLVVLDLLMVVGGLVAAFVGFAYLILAGGVGDLGPGPGWYAPVGLLGLLGGLGLSLLGVFRLLRRPIQMPQRAAPAGDQPPFWPPPPDWTPSVEPEVAGNTGDLAATPGSET